MYYDDYQPFQSFATVDDMNATVREYERTLSGTSRRLLTLLSRYSCKVIGVSWMKADTMAGLLEVSTKTVRRHLKALEQAGMIRRIPTVKAKGGRGYDVCVIKPGVQQLDDEVQQLHGAPCPDDMSTRSTSKIPHEMADNRAGTITEAQVNKLKDIDLDESYVPAGIPSALAKALKPFRSADKTYEFYRRCIIAHKALKLKAPLYDVLDGVLKAVKATIFKYKRGTVRNLYGFFYACVMNELAPVRRREVYDSGRWPIGDWLTDFTNSETAS